MTVVLETENVFLRELLLNDVDPLATLLQTPGAAPEPLGGSPREFIGAQREVYEAGGLGVLAAVHREAGFVVGYAGLRPDVDDENDGDDDAPSLFCLIDPAYRGNGLGGEVARALIAHAFEKLERKRVTAAVLAADGAARRLVERLGFALQSESGEPARRLYSVSRPAP